MTKADLIIHAVWTTWRRLPLLTESVEGTVLDTKPTYPQSPATSPTNASTTATAISSPR
jgi:hypothetical protein